MEAMGGGGFVETGWAANGAVSDRYDDLKPREKFRRAVVSKVGDEPSLRGFVIDGAQELAEAFGPWVSVVENIADRHAREMGKLFELSGAKRRLIEVIADLDGEMTHGKILVAAKV